MPDSTDRHHAYTRSLKTLSQRMAETLEDIAQAFETTAQLAHTHAMRGNDRLDPSTRDLEQQREHRAREYAQLACSHAQRLAASPLQPAATPELAGNG